MKRYFEEGLSLNQMALRLNEEGIKTPRGKMGSWTAKSVSNLVKRLAQN